MRFSRAIAALPFALLCAAPVAAAGGEHVIDDAAVEMPGTCHVEGWVTASSHGSGLTNIAPACTALSLPNVEFGGFLTHSWASQSRDTQIGLAPKFTLRTETTGIGIAIDSGLGYGIDRGRLETASVIMPLTVPAGSRLRFNLNLGWHWQRANGHDAFVGAQAQIMLLSKLELMTELFTRSRDKPGGQIGLRWTPGRGRIDFDLTAGRYVDGATRNALSFGITVRR
jgi:hypothetical protein